MSVIYQYFVSTVVSLCFGNSGVFYLLDFLLVIVLTDAIELNIYCSLINVGKL